MPPQYALPRNTYKWKSILPALTEAVGIKQQGERLTLAREVEERAKRKERREIETQASQVFTKSLEFAFDGKTVKEANERLNLSLKAYNPNFDTNMFKITSVGETQSVVSKGKEYSGPRDLMKKYFQAIKDGKPMLDYDFGVQGGSIKPYTQSRTFEEEKELIKARGTERRIGQPKFSIHTAGPNHPHYRVGTTYKRNEISGDETVTQKPVQSIERIKEEAEAKRAPTETPKQKLQRAKDLAEYKVGLNEKFRDTPAGKLAKAKELEEYKQKLKPERDTALESKIGTIKAAYPEIDDKTATGIATGVIKLIQNPDSGVVSIVDLAESKMRPLGSPESEGKELIPDRPVAGGPTIFGFSDLIAGPGSAAKQAISVVSGMVGAPIFKTTVRARQFALAAQNDLIRALSINPRFPVAEMKRIKEEMAIEPRVLDNSKMLRERIKAIDEFLRIRLKKEINASDNRELSAKDRQDARSAVVRIGDFLEILGNPPTFSSKEDSGYISLPRGEVFFDSNGRLRRKQNE